MAVAANVIGEAGAGLDVVLVLRGIFAEVFEALDARERARLARLVEDDEVRILRLIDRHAGDQVVAEAEVQRQLAADAEVVLDVRRVLLRRHVGFLQSAVQRDPRNRAVHIVGEVRVRVAAGADVVREKEARLVDEARADLEVMAEAAFADDVPGEVVAELPLLLLRLLRDYPREPLLAAVREAARYGLYDLDRVERMILRRVARDYFLLKDSTGGDPEDQ